MKAKLSAYAKAEALFSPGDRVICALSGGGDSMALLHCLHALREELGITVEAAHFNHMLRGEESDGDEAFVIDFCQKLGVPLHLGREDVASYARSHHLGIEEAARQCRYRFFRSLGGKIATAHTADDNLETVLMRWIRGTGLRGLCGIPPKRENVLRPLLRVTKEEILDYLTQEQIPYREDSSNKSLAYTRNRLRHQVLPLLRKENPDLAQGVLQQSRLLRQEDQFLDDLAKKLVQPDPAGGFSILPLRTAPEVLRNRALRLMVGQYLSQDVSLTHIEGLKALIENPCPSAQLNLPQGLVACRRYDSLTFHPQNEHSFSPTTMVIPGETILQDSPWRIRCEIQKNFSKMTISPFHFAIKYDMIEAMMKEPRYIIRPREVGDRLQIANGHSKSLKKLMIEKKIPREERELLPVIAEGDSVLAVGGLGVSAHCLPREGEPALIIHIVNTQI